MKSKKKKDMKNFVPEVENKEYSKNQLIVISLFKDPDNLRDDHFDGKHIFPRFAAYVRKLFGEPILESGYCKDNPDITDILKLLENISIRPGRIYLHDNSVEVEWFTNHSGPLTSLEEYFKISMEFAEYIDSIKYLTLEFQAGTYLDDPYDYIPLSFNKIIYDSKISTHKNIEVLDCIL